ncbi:hypothetical protein K438DRAFT_1972432 [Mycena galopus ATCC 62051]|nr:hypothetical protein K438DRAFT_1972432 [Mycena galopus ATCC 62051]
MHIGADNSLKNQYNTIITTVVESGTLYCLFAIVSAITVTLQTSTFAATIMSSVMASVSDQLVNILPRMIVVRAAMGHNI